MSEKCKKLKPNECPREGCGSNDIKTLGKYLKQCRTCGCEFGTNRWDK